MEDLTSFVCFSMRAVMKKIEKNLSLQLEDVGITIPQSFILSCLLVDDGATLKEIGQKALIDSSSMTVLVDKLEKERLVERQLDTQDRRAIRVFITEKGKKVGEKVVEIGHEFNSHLYDLLGEGNQKEFVHGLNNIINGLE